MTTKETTGDPGAAELRDAVATPQLALQSVYLKDCSYEAPNGPRIEGTWNPQISLDLNTSVSGITPELREVVLTVTVSAKHQETTVFLVEVKQAGIFRRRSPSSAPARGVLRLPFSSRAVKSARACGGAMQRRCTPWRANGAICAICPAPNSPRH